MSVNSTFNSSLHLLLNRCFESRPGLFVFAAFTVANVLFLPLFALVLYMGLRRWRKRRSVPAAVATTSHTDIFTFHMIALELISTSGCCLYCCGAVANIENMVLVGVDMFSITSPGQTLFHVLTCVERYLAVVHPVTYLGLKQSGGVRIRNISVGCVWLSGFATLGLSKVFTGGSFTSVSAPCLLIFSLAVVSFCSLSILFVLIRPGPGEAGGDRARADQSKRRAFHTIAAIMAALFLRFAGILVHIEIDASTQTHAGCVAGASAAWLTLPGSLVLPLLFLHRAGRLPGWKHNSESG